MADLRSYSILQAQEWLYMDGEDASADEFEKHLDSLKTTGEEIFFRSVPKLISIQYLCLLDAHIHVLRVCAIIFIIQF